jgi:hypothetical protein
MTIQAFLDAKLTEAPALRPYIESLTYLAEGQPIPPGARLLQVTAGGHSLTIAIGVKAPFGPVLDLALAHPELLTIALGFLK